MLECQLIRSWYLSSNRIASFKNLLYPMNVILLLTHPKCLNQKHFSLKDVHIMTSLTMKILDKFLTNNNFSVSLIWWKFPQFNFDSCNTGIRNLYCDFYYYQKRVFNSNYSLIERYRNHVMLECVASMSFPNIDINNARVRLKISHFFNYFAYPIKVEYDRHFRCAKWIFCID